MKKSKSQSKKKTTQLKKPGQSISQVRSKIQPLGDRVLIKPSFVTETETKNDFGIIIPETVNKEMPERGKVIAVGDGRYENGKLVPLKVSVGDLVIFSKYGFDEVKADGDTLYILKEDSILAIIN